MTGARGSPREQNPAYRACTYGDAAFQRHPLFSGRYRNGTDGGEREEHPGEAEKARKGKNAKGRVSHAAGIGRVAFFLTYRPPMATLGEHIRQSTAYNGGSWA